MKTYLHKPGDPAPVLGQADFILTHANTFVGKLIRFGEKRVGPGRWNHAALSLGGDRLAEALGHGVVESSLSKYDGVEYLAVIHNSSAEDRAQMMNFADSVLKRRAKYGYLEIFCLALTLLFRLSGRRFLFSSSGSMICSGFVAEVQTRGWAVYDVPPGYVTPDDLADSIRPKLEVR
jgi:hypothetical protein